MSAQTTRPKYGEFWLHISPLDMHADLHCILRNAKRRELRALRTMQAKLVARSVLAA